MNLKKSFIALVWTLLVLISPALLSSQNTLLQVESNRFAQNSQIGSVAERAAEAGRITSIAQTNARNILRSAYNESVTQWDVSKHLEAVMRAEGADGPLAFATLTMSGPELVEPHGNPFDDQIHVINPATEPVIMIDMGCKYQNHSSDVTRTYFFESATQQMKDAYSAVLAAEEAAIAAIAPGVTIGELDAIVRTELSAYIGEEGVSFYPYWGHGVGFFVHEYPTLYEGNAGIELKEDQVLALEPNLFFNDGWAVRVEDIVLVTSTGVEVLSDSPKAIESVSITPEDSLVTTTISINNYEYNGNVNVLLEVEDSAARAPSSADFFDGRSWHTMIQIGSGEFSHSYWLLEHLYSGFISSAFRIRFPQDIVYFTEELVAAPSNTSEVALSSPVVLNSEGAGVSTATVWTFHREDAVLVRLHFTYLTTNDGSQTLLSDSDNRVVQDIRISEAQDLWSPWIAGDTAWLSVNPISANGVYGVGFVVDRLDVAYPTDYTPSATTTPSTPSTSPTSFQTSPTSAKPPPPPAGEIDLAPLIAGIVGLTAVGIVFLIARDLRS